MAKQNKLKINSLKQSNLKTTTDNLVKLQIIKEYYLFLSTVYWNIKYICHEHTAGTGKNCYT